MKLSSYLTIIGFIFILLFSCARQGSPTGGPKDEDAPVLVITKPAHKTTNFNEKEIKIYFDEYVVLKDLNKQLIVSPPLETPAVITPQTTASKFLKIKLLDTLQQNTTYTFNFGNAIRDYNEGNVIEDFKYIFSTGEFLDSLTSTGSVINALEGKLRKNVSVLLYEYDSTFTDSIIFKQKPKYVTRTVDSVHFQFSNIKEGKYMMLAIDENATDYIFSSRSDKLAFLLDTIQLPRDSILNKELVLFKEQLPFKFKRGKEVSKGRILFGYEGEQEDLKVKLLTQVPDEFKSAQEFEKETDTLNYWYTPIEDLDSLNFVVSHKDFVDSITVKLRKKKLDSLTVTSSLRGVLNPLDTFFIKTNNPIDSLNQDKFSFISDSLPVNFSLKKHNKRSLAVLFDREQNKEYKLSILPDAIFDLYKTSNDSLDYYFNTRSIEDYGTIELDIDNKTNSNLIVELLSGDNVVKTVFLNESENSVKFSLLEPKTYKIRTIVDNNANNKWDTGSYLLKRLPEKIIYIDKELELRANWVLSESITIE